MRQQLSRPLVLIPLLATLTLPAFADPPRRVEEPTPRRETIRQVDEDRKVVVVRPKSRVVVRAGDGEREQDEDRAVTVRRAFLGVEATPLTPELRRHFGVAEDRGVLLGRVVENSPAERAGLEVGDVITAVDGVAISSQHQLGREIRRYGDGESIAVDYVRSGRPHRTQAVVEERETARSFAHGFDFDHDFDIDVDLDLEELERLGELTREHLEGLEISIDPAALEALGARLEEMMESEEWQLQMERLEDLDLHGLELRMEELHERMEHLGVELEQRGQRLERRVVRDQEREPREPV